MDNKGQLYLILGSTASFIIAAVHVAIILIGPSAYEYFGGDYLVPLVERGSPFPALLTLGIAFIFVVWGVYALSGAGVTRRLPLMRTALIIVGTLCTLRGLDFVQDIFQRLFEGFSRPVKFTVFSAVSLAVGLLYLVGVIGQWQRISLTTRPAAEGIEHRQEQH